MCTLLVYTAQLYYNARCKNHKNILIFQCSVYMKRVKTVQIVWNTDLISFKYRYCTYTLHCCRWHKFTIKSLLCNI
jgi:hypothetical protein